ncbi:hypothetical protein [Pseudomonas sp. S2_H08]
MTAVQIYALIAIILTTAAVCWLTYRSGFSNGHSEGQSQGYDVGCCVGYRDGINEGKAIQSADNSEDIRNLTHSLNQARDQYKELYAHYERTLAASKLGEPARQTLLDIAEKLRIAAATFNALRTGKVITRETTALCDQALAMAELLKPTERTGVAKVVIEPFSSPLSKVEAEKAALFFQQDHQAIATKMHTALGGAA